jgi:ABC-type transport system involved in cytochrome c biogenesis permease subunit
MIRLLLIFIICCISLPTHAQEKLDYNHFKQLPILDNGRIKPLGAYANIRMKDFSDNDKNATAWLAETLFNPSEAIDAKIFTIKDDNLKTRLKLDTAQNHFNIADLEKGITATQQDIIVLLQNDQSDITPQQQALLKIHENVASYIELLRSFSLILPLEGNTNFRDLLPDEQQIIKDLKSIIAKKGEDITAYTEDEQKTALIGFQLQQIRAGGIQNDDLKILPSNINETIEWIAPWQIINEGKGSPQTSKLLDLWQSAATAYRNNDPQKWSETTQELLAETHKAANNQISQTRLSTELIYQKIKPYHLAMGFYALGILLIIIKRNNAAFGALSIALLSHIFGITARIYILDRPPVGTLYESVLFVSLICAIIAAVAWLKTRKPIIPLTGKIAALGLLAIAPTMLQNNDSLELLVAVLNTNFWLATHVLCITAGYGVCILAACLAHAYMIIRIKNAAHQILPTIAQSIHNISLIALLLTAVGTVLGGIWADQSWGRFWGWDPKENGALLIVLWLIWAQHGKISGHLRPLNYIAIIAALNIIVALAWFGVNLLGVGLHSYGFTSGIATGLAVFCLTEAALISGLWITIRRKQQNT